MALVPDLARFANPKTLILPEAKDLDIHSHPPTSREIFRNRPDEANCRALVDPYGQARGGGESGGDGV